MLTKGQKEYLKKLTDEERKRPVEIKKHDPNRKETARQVTEKISTVIPNAEILFMGSAALGIMGQNDIDICILYSKGQRAEHVEKISKLFGDVDGNKWKWLENGHNISVRLSDSRDVKTKEQVEIFEVFKNNSDVLKEYEKIKVSHDGVPYEKYQTEKFKFYNKVLGIR